MTLVYKIVPEKLWRDAERFGMFAGASIDLVDGYIHFSTAGQTQETADKHFAGQTGLLLVAVEADDFGGDMKWEVSRGGALFPHLHMPLPVHAARSVKPIPIGVDGRHDFSGLLT
jgi:uncharacterized protein (DUF952 family)